MGRRSTACQTCQTIKAKCTKEFPCARCKRLSLPCRYGASRVLARDRSPQPAKGGTKIKHSKSATGCTNCRQRRKKCDEKRPKCTDCERLQLSCDQQIQSDPVGSPAGDAKSPAPCAPSVIDKHFTTQAFLSWMASNGTKAVESSLQLSSFSYWLSLIESEYRIVAARRPILENSTAQAGLGLPCASDDDIGLARFFPSTALNNLTGVSAQSLRTWAIGDRYLLNHFLQSVSRALVVVEDKRNPFLRMIVPLALESSLVQHSLLALSACHLRGVFSEFEHDLYVHRTQSLRELRAEFDSQDASIWALTATLLLCLVEVSYYILPLH